MKCPPGRATSRACREGLAGAMKRETHVSTGDIPLTWAGRPRTGPAIIQGAGRYHWDGPDDQRQARQAWSLPPRQTRRRWPQAMHSKQRVPRTRSSTFSTAFRGLEGSREKELPHAPQSMPASIRVLPR